MPSLSLAAVQTRAQMRKTVVDLVLATDMKQVRIERQKELLKLCPWALAEEGKGVEEEKGRKAGEGGWNRRRNLSSLCCSSEPHQLVQESRCL